MGIEALVAAATDIFGIGAADAGIGAAAAGTEAALGAGTEAALGAGAATAAETGLATLPAELIGTGAALDAGTTGLAGTLAASGSGLGLGDLVAGTAGLGALGTAGDVAATGGGLGAASGPGFGAAADAAAQTAAQTGLASGVGSFSTPDIAALSGAQPFASGGVSSSLPANVANANASMAAPSSSSVFTTGTTPVTASPGVSSASALAAPSGVTPALGVDPTAAATSAATPAAAAPSSLDSLLGKVGTSISNNPLQALGIATGLGGLGYNIVSGQKATANQGALTNAASTAADTSKRALDAGLPIAQANNATGTGLINSGEALQTYLSSGQLPPQYTQQIDQAINDAKTRAISNAAQQGMPTDPTKNTSLAATLAGIDNQRAAMTTQVAQTLFNAGSSDINAGAGLTTGSASSLIGAGQNAAGLSGQLYQTLVQNDTTQAANTGKAIASLAAALNGKSSTSAGNVTINTR